MAVYYVVTYRKNYDDEGYDEEYAVKLDGFGDDEILFFAERLHDGINKVKNNRIDINLCLREETPGGPEAVTCWKCDTVCSISVHRNGESIKMMKMKGLIRLYDTLYNNNFRNIIIYSADDLTEEEQFRCFTMADQQVDSQCNPVACFRHIADQIRRFREPVSLEASPEPILSPSTGQDVAKDETVGGNVTKNKSGRKPPSPEEINSDNEIVAEWKANKRAAKGDRLSKKEFAKDRGIRVEALNAAIDRVRKREKRSEMR